MLGSMAHRSSSSSLECSPPISRGKANRLSHQCHKSLSGTPNRHRHAAGLDALLGGAEASMGSGGKGSGGRGSEDVMTGGGVIVSANLPPLSSEVPLSTSAIRSPTSQHHPVKAPPLLLPMLPPLSPSAAFKSKHQRQAELSHAPPTVQPTVQGMAVHKSESAVAPPLLPPESPEPYAVSDKPPPSSAPMTVPAATCRGPPSFMSKRPSSPSTSLPTPNTTRTIPAGETISLLSECQAAPLPAPTPALIPNDGIGSDAGAPSEGFLGDQSSPEEPSPTSAMEGARTPGEDFPQADGSASDPSEPPLRLGGTFTFQTPHPGSGCEREGQIEVPLIEVQIPPIEEGLQPAGSAAPPPLSSQQPPLLLQQLWGKEDTSTSPEEAAADAAAACMSSPVLKLVMASCGFSPLRLLTPACTPLRLSPATNPADRPPALPGDTAAVSNGGSLSGRHHHAVSGTERTRGPADGEVGDADPIKPPSSGLPPDHLSGACEGDASGGGPPLMTAASLCSASLLADGLPTGLADAATPADSSPAVVDGGSVLTLSWPTLTRQLTLKHWAREGDSPQQPLPSPPHSPICSFAPAPQPPQMISPGGAKSPQEESCMGPAAAAGFTSGSCYPERQEGEEGV